MIDKIFIIDTFSPDTSNIVTYLLNKTKHPFEVIRDESCSRSIENSVRECASISTYQSIWKMAYALGLDKILIIEKKFIVDGLDFFIKSIFDDIIIGNDICFFNKKAVNILVSLEPNLESVADYLISLIPHDFLSIKSIISENKCTSLFYECGSNPGSHIQIVTVASDPTDGYERFVESCNFYKFPFVVLGMGEPWIWDLTMGPGGGRKVNLLKSYLDKFSDDDERLILFSDSYDVVINDNPQSIINKFSLFNTDVLFSGETSIWPQKSLEPLFPRHSQNSPYIYLNSGGFMGSIKNIKSIILQPILDADDDQLYYQKIFIWKNSCPKIKLDYTCLIFQTLTSLFSDISVRYGFNSQIPRIHNKLFPDHSPSIIHGNGGVESKLFLNNLSNYIPSHIQYPKILSTNENDFVNYTMTFIIQIKKATKINVTNLLTQNYPRDKCKYLFYGTESLEKLEVESILSTFGHSIHYTYSQVTPASMKKFFIQVLTTNTSEYYFLGTTDHILDDKDTIRKLILSEKRIISPMVVSKTQQLFSNFWGAVDENGFYTRSWDYIDIVTQKKRGIWNVPYVTGSILIDKKRIDPILKELSANEHKYNKEDFDMFFCRVLRQKYIFLHVMNIESYGKIID